MLPAEDIAYLDGKKFNYSVEHNGSAELLIIKNYELPPGFTPAVTDLLLDVPSGYPDAGLDMFWVRPAVKLGNGAYAPASEVFEPKFGDEQWQRFSRHGYPWGPGDSIASYLTWIRRELEANAKAVSG